MNQWSLRRFDSGESWAGDERPFPHAGGLADPMRALFEQFPGLFWTTDLEHTLTSCLGRTLSSIGVGPNQLVGTEVTRLFEPKDEVVLEAHARALLGETVSFRLPMAGRNLDARMAPISDADGRTVGVIGVGVETTSAARSAGPTSTG